MVEYPFSPDCAEMSLLGDGMVVGRAVEAAGGTGLAEGTGTDYVVEVSAYSLSASVSHWCSWHTARTYASAVGAVNSAPCVSIPGHVPT